MNKEAQLSPPMSVQKFAIGVAYRLSSLRNFLEASEDLCRYNERLTDIDIQRHGRKVGLRRITCRSHIFSPPTFTVACNDGGIFISPAVGVLMV
jgi:hypothetical protein